MRHTPETLKMRRAVMLEIEMHDGITIAQLVQLLGITNSQAQKRLNELRSMGKAAPVKVGRLMAWFLPHRIPSPSMEGVPETWRMWGGFILPPKNKQQKIRTVRFDADTGRPVHENV